MYRADIYYAAGQCYKIPAGCFQGCSSLQEIKLGSQVTEIGDMAFALCTSLETFTFPETVTAVGLKLFFGCAKLQEVTLPESLTTLGTQMFSPARHWKASPFRLPWKMSA